VRASIVALGEVSHSIVDGPFGSNLKISDYVEIGVPVLQGKNITGDQFLWKEVRYITPTKAKELARSSVEVGDHLVVKIGSIGYSAIIDHLNGHPSAIIPANLARIRPNRRLIDDRYLHHWLVSKEAKRYFVGVASKTAQPALSLTKIKEARLPLPPLDEQRRIAAILDKADALCRKRKRAVELLDSLTQSIFLEMFGDPVSNPQGWAAPQLGEICERLTVGIVVKPASYYTASGVIALRSLNIRENAFDLADVVFVSPEDNTGALTKTRIFKDDVVIIRTGQPGKAAVVPADLDNANAIDILIATPSKSTLNPQYLCDLLNSSAGKAMVLENKRGQIQQHLNVGSLKAAKLPIPPIAAQNDYVERSSRLRPTKLKAHSNLEGLTYLYSSLQHRAFSGQL
jgi:type I restriction enzyme, S subunit